MRVIVGDQVFDGSVPDPVLFDLLNFAFQGRHRVLVARGPSFERWRSSLSRGAHASPGNRFLLPVRRVGELRRHLADATGHPWAAIEPIAKSHAIQEDARTMLVRGDERGFVMARRRALDDLEKRVLDSHLDALG